MNGPKGGKKSNSVSKQAPKEDEVIYGFETGQVYSISERYKMHIFPIYLNALKGISVFNSNNSTHYHLSENPLKEVHE